MFNTPNYIAMKKFVFIIFCLFLSVYQLSAQDSSEEAPSKPGVRKSLYIGLRGVGSYSIPNLNYSAVKSINEFVCVGIGIGYQNISGFHSIGLVGKVEGNVFPIAEAISQSSLGITNVELYLGIQGGYVFSVYDFGNVFGVNGLDGISTFSRFGVYGGGRYFFSNKVGVMIEVGMFPTGINTFGAGLVFRKS